MSTVVHIIDKVTEWVSAEICSKIKLKMPPDDNDGSNAAGYEYTLITPASFSFFLPSKDKLPPSIISPIPAVCVRPIGGTDNLVTSAGSLNIELAFSAWSTGEHGKEIFVPDKENGLHFTQGKETEYFQKSAEGWRDCWNWIDIALRAIAGSATINGIQIDRATAVTYGQFTEQESIPDFYPFWFAWIHFSVNRQLIRNIPEYSDLL